MLFFLQNESLKIAINDKGAELCSMQSLSTGIEYIWQADAAFWSRHSPILFPIVGRLKKDQYSYQGKTYNLSQHGFVRDAQFKCISESDLRMIFKLTSSAESLTIYPFPFELFVNYQLHGTQLTVELTVTNTADSPMYFSIGAHPAFNLPIFEQETLDMYYLLFDKKEIISHWHIKEGLLTNTQNLLLNNENQLALSEELFENDALVLKHIRSERISICHRLRGEVLDIIFPDFPYLGIWKKPNAPFLCIEPWYGIADSIQSSGELKEKEGIQLLEANEEFTRSYSIIIHP